MSSSKEYMDFIIEQLSSIEDMTYRKMMGEYVIYYKGKVVGGVYDDRFLIKITPSAISIMPDAERQLPYEGGKEMLLVDDPEDREKLDRLVRSVYAEL